MSKRYNILATAAGVLTVFIIAILFLLVGNRIIDQECAGYHVYTEECGRHIGEQWLVYYLAFIAIVVGILAIISYINYKRLEHDAKENF